MSSIHLASTHRHLDFKRLAQTLLTGVCAFACGAAIAVTSSQATQLRLVSGADPFAACTADDPTDQPGTLYPDSEIEPRIAANPRDGRNLIAVWQQDRWSNGGARGTVAGYTTDGGLTWSKSIPPNVSKCSGGTFDRASDPWITFSPDGTAYFMSLVVSFRSDGALSPNGMVVNRSTNGGVSWSNSIPLIIDTSAQVFNDKNAITADPFDSKYVYAVWDRLVDFEVPPDRPQSGIQKISVDPRIDGVVAARDRVRKRKAMAASGKAVEAPIIGRGPTYFTRTSNGGRSWEIPRSIYDPGRNAQTIGNIVDVLANGDVANFFTNISSLDETRIGMVKSANKGKTFGRASLPLDLVLTPTGTLTPNSQESVRDGAILFDVAVDQGNGNIYLVWQDGRWDNIDRVAFSQSTDNGVTWSRPVQINMTPPSTARLRNQAFTPAVEVGNRHEIVVTYYDFRFDTSDGRERTDYFAVFCTPGSSVDCSKRRNWGDRTTRLKDVRLTQRSFDILNAPVARGHFLGDYMGLAKRGGSVFPAFGIADGPNRNSIYTRPIPPAGSLISSSSGALLD